MIHYGGVPSAVPYKKPTFDGDGGVRGGGFTLAWLKEEEKKPNLSFLNAGNDPWRVVHFKRWAE